MALNEINYHNDGQADDLLPGYVFKTSLSSPYDFYGTIESTMKLNRDSFKNSGDTTIPVTGGIDCAVGAVDTARTMASNLMFDHYRTVQVSSIASGAELSVGTNYPRKLRTMPSLSFPGMVLQDIIYSHFGYRRVTVFCTNDFFASRAAWDFSDGTFGAIELLSFHQVVSGTTDYAKEIAAAKTAGSLVFVLFMSAADAGTLVVQGRKSGLFREGTILFGHESIISADTANTILQIEPAADVAALLKGFIGVKFDPSYTTKYTPQGQAFLERWKNQAQAPCNNDKDGDGDFFINSIGGLGQVCLTLDFANVAPDSSAVLTYDAVYALARGLHTVLVTDGVPISALNGDILMKAMLKVSFTGASGLVEFFDGVQPDASVSDDLYGRGDREAGLTYGIYNFDPASKAFVPVGRWDVESEFQLCDALLEKSVEGKLLPCLNSVVYDTHDNLPPPDRPPTIYKRLPAAISALLYVLGAIAIAIVVTTASLLVYYRHSRLVKASQPPLIALILVGELVACVRVVIGGSSELGSPVLDGVCTAKFWTGHFAFALTFGSLFIKTWRVNKVLNSQSLKRVKISNNFVLAVMALVILALGVYLAVATGIGRPRVIYTVVVTNNQAVVSMTCGLYYPQFETTLFVIEAVLLAWGARLCYATQNVPDAINESKFIAGTMSIIVLICSLVIPIIYLIGLDSIIVEVIASLAFWLSVLTTVLLLYAPKLMILVAGGDADEKFGIGAKRPTGSLETDKEDSLGRKGGNNAVQSVMRTTCLAALKGKSLDEKFALAQGEIVWWRSVLVQIEEKRTSSATSGEKLSRSSVSKVHDGDMDSELDHTAALTVTTNSGHSAAATTDHPV